MDFFYYYFQRSLLFSSWQSAAGDWLLSKTETETAVRNEKKRSSEPERGNSISVLWKSFCSVDACWHNKTHLLNTQTVERGERDRILGKCSAWYQNDMHWTQNSCKFSSIRRRHRTLSSPLRIFSALSSPHLFVLKKVYFRLKQKMLS